MVIRKWIKIFYENISGHEHTRNKKEGGCIIHLSGGHYLIIYARVPYGRGHLPQFYKLERLVSQ